MKRAAILFLLMLRCGFSSPAQSFYTVIAKNGVAVRRNPDFNSERIGALGFKQTVAVIRITGQPSTVGLYPSNKFSQWAEIRLDNKTSGFVSEQYLLKSHLKPADDEPYCMDSEEPPDSAYISFKKFSIRIYCYRLIKNCYDDRIRKDSVYVCEETFFETSNKIIEVIPKKEIDSVNLFCTNVESIEEQINWAKVGELTKQWSAEKWYKNTVHWKGMEEFVRLEKKGNFFRLPVMQYKNLEKSRKEKMALRDTLVDLSGEASNVATLIYKGRPCRYNVESLILKIVIYPKNMAPEERFVKIILSYGC